MGRRRHARLDAVDGLLLLNKPAGLTSNQALQRVRRLLNAQKAGHTGSLDPAATGMLPLCFGEATKVCAFLLDADKTYRVTARLGSRTDTGDRDGSVVETADVPELDAEDWLELLNSFLGDSMQVPPMYSALRKEGRRLYELARKGETVERDARPIRIHAIELLEIAGTRLVFRVRCSKGTYVRTLVEDVAARAGTVAYTLGLHREALGAFRAGDMMELSGVEAAAEKGPDALKKKLLPADVALEPMPRVELGEDSGLRFEKGQSVGAQNHASTGLVRVYSATGRFLGVGESGRDGRLAPRRVFSMSE